MKSFFKGIITLGLALAMAVGSIYFDISATVFAETATPLTIRMGDNAPMTRDEFMEWREQRNIRFFNLDERIYPAGVFFNSYSGNAFRYGELNDRVLYVYPIPGVVSDNRSNSTNNVSDMDAPTEEIPRGIEPVIFYDLTPILFSDEELTAMIERVPHESPMDIRSSITLPNRRLTEYELEAWINDYNEMGGATAFELGVIREVNRVRARYGLHLLALCPALMMAARLKAQEFGDLQYYSHRSPVHGSPGEAAGMFGIERLIGENMTRTGSSSVPALRTTPERIVGGMLASNRGHRELLLHPNLYSVGFGSFFSPNSTGPDGNMSHMFYHVTQFGFRD